MHDDPNGTPPRGQRVQDAFAEAVALPTLARASFLSRLRAGDASLADEVESLLGFHARGKAEDDDPTLSLPGTLVGETVGGCRLERLVGFGGMSAVYAATQEFPRRRVAVKIVRRERMSDSATRRLRVEAEALARLEHPNIARVYAAGMQRIGHGDGGTETPFIVMELVEHAMPVSKWADERKLGAVERIELVARIADAVEHAHRAGVIHRDLKPGNVVVGADGSPKIVDFGIASVLDSSVTAATEGPMGTLAYMSPEQARGGTIDTRSDVWGLGALLYDLLAGRPPFASQQLPLAAHIDRLLHDAPDPLAGAALPERGAGFVADFPAATESVVRRALATDPERRYRSAAEFADELRHLVRGEPLLAAPDSEWDSFRRLVHRHRAPLGAAAGVFAVVVGALVVSLLLLRSERDAHERAEWSAYIASISAAASMVERGDASAAADMLAAAPLAHRGWEWHALRGRTSQSEWSFDYGDGNQVYDLEYSGDGSTILVAASKYFSAIDARTHEELWRTPVGHPVPAWRMAPLADGAIIAASLEGPTIRLARDGSIERSVPLGDVLDLCTTADRTRVFTTAVRGARELDPQTLAVRREITADPPLTGYPRALAVSADGSLLVTGDMGGEVVAFDAATGSVRWRWRPAGPPSEVRGVSFSDDGSRVAAGGGPHLAVFDAASGTVIWHQQRSSRGYRSPRFTPDGRSVLVANYAETVDRHDAATGAPLAEIAGTHSQVWTIALSPDGRTVLAGSLKARIDAFDVEASMAPRQHALDGSAVRSLSAGDRVFAATAAGGLFEISRETHAVRRVELPFGAFAVHAMPDGTLAVGSDDGAAWITPEGRVLRRAPLGSKGVAVGDADSGRTTFVILDDERMVALDSSTGASRYSMAHFALGARTPVALDGSGMFLATRGQQTRSPSVHISLADGSASKSTLPLEYATVARWSPDGSVLAIGDVRQHAEVMLFERGSLRLLAELPNHRAAVRAISWCPDGSRLATASADDTVRIWHASRHAEMLTAWKQSAADIAFDAGGVLWIACADGFVRSITPK